MATRIDSWIWGIRLTKTRSAAGAACRAGHVQVNGVTAKPATPVAVGDEVRVRIHGRDRIVEVTKLISKRVSAPAAAECYLDHSPPPPPREVLAGIPRRDPGAGRPTKRERRQLDRLRSMDLLVLAVLAVIALLVSGCGGDGADAADTTSTPKAGAGPKFERCGGLTLDEVQDETGVGGMRLYIDNTAVCEWRTDDYKQGGTVSFNWYRGSPIGRERGHEQLSGRDHVEDLSIAGYPGFLAVHSSICEVGVQFEGDFIEISVRGDDGGTGTYDTEKYCDGAKALAAKAIERAS
ncbi:DUF3558 family protein [Gordonia sp. VNK21]|uniref:DUF3558 family protein n=1 Tax=Gordonia sp. VNK21 TaxID=3382483 RepID=UPI0038D4D76C